MKGNIVSSKLDYIEQENALFRRMREAAIKKCGTLVLLCSEIDNKWGIWMEIDDEKLLVNPVELVSSIYEDNNYYMLESQNKNMPGYFMVEVEKKDYCYHWTLSHSMLNFSSENRYVQEEYVSTIYDAISQLYEVVQAGGELAYERGVYKECVISCYKQLQVKCTWPSYIRKTTKDIKVEEFRFDVIKGNDGERFSIGIGDRIYSTWFTHWDGSLEWIRHQLETIAYDEKAEVKIDFDMSKTIIKLEDISVISEMKETDNWVRFKHKDFMLVTIIPNEFVKQPIFKGYCERIDMVNTLYNGLLRMALDHPDNGIDHVPNLLNAYNMVKSPLLEDFISDRLKDKDDIIYYNRQVHVKHIITIRPDEFHLFEDEKHVSYGVKSDGTLDFLYDQQGKPIVMKDFITWQSSVKDLVQASPEGIKYYKDWFEFHKQGLRLVRELRKVLSTDFDIWFEPPVGDQSDFIEHGVLVGPTRNY